MWWSNSSFSLTGLILSPASSVCPGKAQGSSRSSTIMTTSRSSGPGFHLQDALCQQSALPPIPKRMDMEPSFPWDLPNLLHSRLEPPSIASESGGWCFHLLSLSVFPGKGKLETRETSIFEVTTWVQGEVSSLRILFQSYTNICS